MHVVARTVVYPFAQDAFTAEQLCPRTLLHAMTRRVSMRRFHGFANGVAAAMACMTVLALAACGGDAAPSGAATASTASSGDDGEASVASASATSADAALPERLFLPDLAHRAIAAVATLEPDAGEVLPAPTLGMAAAIGSNVQV